MINKVSILNFKCLRDVHVDLERFTVFVGPNASGKSSILQALDILCRAFRTPDEVQRLGRVSNNYKGITQIQDPETEFSEAASRGAIGRVAVEVETGGSRCRYWTKSWPLVSPLPPGKSDGLAVSHGTDEWKPWQPQQDRPLPLSILLRLETSKLVEPTLPGVMADPTVMAPDGSGLHSALASMTLNDPDSWQALQGDLKRIIPTIRRLRHTKAGQMNEPTSVLFDMIGADSLRASQVSEGTLLVLGLLAALHAPGRPNLVLLDDLDRGLHPKAQKELITLLRGLLNTNPDLQIVATTHSPYMLDCMDVSEVRMTFLKDDGSTVCAPLASHPNFPKWKDEMTPGEMWSLFGEKWVAEKEKVSA